MLRSGSPRGRGQTPRARASRCLDPCVRVLSRSAKLCTGHFININSGVVAEGLLRLKDTHYTVSLFPKEIPRV